jgi:hypothetical protein
VVTLCRDSSFFPLLSLHFLGLFPGLSRISAGRRIPPRSLKFTLHLLVATLGDSFSSLFSTHACICTYIYVYIGDHSKIGKMQSDPAIPSGDRDEKQSESGPAPGQILTGKQEHCEIRPV